MVYEGHVFSTPLGIAVYQLLESIPEPMCERSFLWLQIISRLIDLRTIPAHYFRVQLERMNRYAKQNEYGWPYTMVYFVSASSILLTVPIKGSYLAYLALCANRVLTGGLVDWLGWYLVDAKGSSVL